MCMRASCFSYRSLCAGVALLLSSVVMLSVQARDASPELTAVPSVTRSPGVGVNLAEASEIARETHGGEVIKAELTRYKGFRVYMVRLLEAGRVRDVLIDAASGTLLEPEQPE